MGMLAVSESPRAFDQRGSRWHQAVARLKPGVSLPQANADLTAIAHQLGQGARTNTGYGLAVFSLKDEIVGQLAPLLLTLLAAVGFVLLIACVNLANLLLARATTRQRETAIRAALGADRRRLARQFLAEGLLLSGLGAASGLLLALWGMDAIVALAPQRLPSFVNPHLDWRVLAFVAAVTCGAGLLLGLLPAVQGSRADLSGVLKDGARGSSGGQSRARLRSILVVAEVALSLVLLAGAGLMVRSFLNLQRIDVGFQPQRVMTMKVALPEKDAGRLSQVASLLAARIGAVSLVEHVALGTDAPFSGDTSASYLSPEGSAAGVLDPGIRVYHHGVTPGFFAALGAGLMGGRDFDAHDTADTRPVAIVSHRFASKAWPGVDPVGRRFTIGRGGTPDWVTVVGVAPDLRYRSVAVDVKKSPEDPDVYFPLAQRPAAGLSVLVSSSARPVSLIASVREAVHDVDRDIPTFAEGPMTGLIVADTADFRLSASVMSLFGLVALLLSGVGVYGLINYSVAQRRQEIGVRVALGAGRGEIYGMVLKDAMRLTVAGIVIGVSVTLPAARLLGAQLYGITTSDPGTYASIVALLLTVAIGAALLPARRAARLDPIVALRME